MGNVFLIFHVSLLLVAQRCFFRQSPGWPVCWGFILLFAAVMTWSVAIDGRIAVRVMISSATFLVLSTLIIWQLWRHGRPDYQVAVWVLIGLNLVLIAMTLMRMFTVWGEVIESPFQRQLFNVLPYVSMLVGSSMLTFGVLLLCNQHRALELRYQASHDPLTGLFNRRGFMERLARGRPAQQGALVVLDLDDFKQINDWHGHEVGIGCWSGSGWHCASWREYWPVALGARSLCCCFAMPPQRRRLPVVSHCGFSLRPAR